MDFNADLSYVQSKQNFSGSTLAAFLASQKMHELGDLAGKIQANNKYSAATKALSLWTPLYGKS